LVFSSGESLVIETAPSQGEAIVSHLDRYLFRENVEIFDRTEAWGEILVAGAASESLLGQFGAPLAGLRRLGTTEANFAGCVVSVSRVQTAGPVGFLLRTTRDDVAAIGDRLRSAGAVQCSAAAIEAARIESGIPTFGVDVTAANLPQEVSRDATAIHFNKGCYIGQETVARIDALGHVNRHLCGVAFAAGDVPPPGTELSGDGRPVGKVTSSAYSPRLDAPLALAYLRRGHHTPGVRLASSYGTAEVVHLPVWRKEA
jgi:folate-binding protein YgfZ